MTHVSELLCPLTEGRPTAVTLPPVPHQLVGPSGHLNGSRGAWATHDFP
jgi:hypothetical protein